MDTEKKPEWAQPELYPHGNAFFARVANGDLAGVRRFLDAGADPMHYDPDPAIVFGPYPIFNARTAAMVHMLVAAGADPNASHRDDFGDMMTPLIAAVTSCRYDLVKALLDAGADPTLNHGGEDIQDVLSELLFWDRGNEEHGYHGIMRLIRDHADRRRLAAAINLDDREDDQVEESAF